MSLEGDIATVFYTTYDIYHQIYFSGAWWVSWSELVILLYVYGWNHCMCWWFGLLGFMAYQPL